MTHPTPRTPAPLCATGTLPAESLPDLSPDEISRYTRQVVLPELGLDGQRRLKAARVAVIGAGGLGSPVIQYLAAAGVGMIRVIDDDLVEVSNLGRQVIHSTSQVGMPKVDSAAHAVTASNPFVRVETRRYRLTPGNAVALLTGVDLVIDGSDEFDTRYAVADAAEALGVPVVWGAVHRFAGHVSVFSSRNGYRYRDLFPEPPADDDAPPCEVAGVLGAVCAMVGSTMAAETLKLLTGIGHSLLGRLQVIDALQGSVRTIALVRGKPIPPATTTADAGQDSSIRQPAATSEKVQRISAGEVRARLAAGESFTLVDVRSVAEHAAGALPGTIHVPFPELISQGPPETVPLDRPIVLYCASGVRSTRAVPILRAHGATDVASLTGGYLTWHAEPAT
ncbi:ThiF family adenylyltransferase [Microbacterium sp. C23T]